MLIHVLNVTEIITVSDEEIRAEFVPRSGFPAVSGLYSIQKCSEFFFHFKTVLNIHDRVAMVCLNKLKL